jgi:hypothetical protein
MICMGKFKLVFLKEKSQCISYFLNMVISEFKTLLSTPGRKELLIPEDWEDIYTDIFRQNLSFLTRKVKG